MAQMIRIGMALGIDGYGAAVLGAMLGGALWKRSVEMGCQCRLSVYSHLQDFMACLFEKIPKDDLVLIRCQHGIFLPKINGGIDVPATFAMLQHYEKNVAKCLQKCHFDPDVDIFIAVCAPHYLAKAFQLGVPADRLVRVEDHAWSKTLLDCLSKTEFCENQQDMCCNR